MKNKLLTMMFLFGATVSLSSRATIVQYFSVLGGGG